MSSSRARSECRVPAQSAVEFTWLSKKSVYEAVDVGYVVDGVCFYSKVRSSTSFSVFVKRDLGLILLLPPFTAVRLLLQLMAVPSAAIEWPVGLLKIVWDESLSVYDSCCS